VELAGAGATAKVREYWESWQVAPPGATGAQPLPASETARNLYTPGQGSLPKVATPTGMVQEALPRQACATTAALVGAEQEALAEKAQAPAPQVGLP